MEDNMAGFVTVLSAAIPVVQTIVDQIKNSIDTKTKQASDQAAKAASDQIRDPKKGSQAAAAATPVVANAAKEGAQEVADSLSASYKKAQLDLSEQLAVVASLRPFFAAEDHIFAIRQVLDFKDRRLSPDDVEMIKTWWKTASDSLKEIAQQDASLLKLEDPERTTIRYVGQANGDGVVNDIEQAFGTLGGRNPRFAILADKISNLHDRLDKATFSALSVLQDLSDGLKKAAS
jgi:hypothetical protein